jgi:hypothetical protein
MRHPLALKVATNFADKRWSFGGQSPLADQGHGVVIIEHVMTLVSDARGSVRPARVWEMTFLQREN